MLYVVVEERGTCGYAYFEVLQARCYCQEGKFKRNVLSECNSPNKWIDLSEYLNFETWAVI